MQASRVRALDPTRPVTAAFCGVNDQADAYFADLDVASYNYVLDHPHVVGDFVWTGMDYLGESGIGFTALEGDPPQERWPYHGAVCGDIDICGFKKPASYYRDILWGRSKLEMAVHRPLPAGRTEWLNAWGWPDEHRHWTWPGRDGEPLQVSVYSTADRVRLVLNGRTLGVQPVSRATRFTARFDVPYEAGELHAVALVKGRAVATLAFRTAGAPQRLRLAADRVNLRARNCTDPGT